MADHLDERTKSLLEKCCPTANISGADSSKMSEAAFPSVQYTAEEAQEVEQWLPKSAQITSETPEQLKSLNTHLSTRTTVLGSKPSIADVALYGRLSPIVSSWSDEQRTGQNGYHHIVRYIDFVQNSPLVGLKLSESDKIKVDANTVLSKIAPIDPKAEKERKKKEKEAAAAASAGETPAVSKDAATTTKSAIESVVDTAQATLQDVGAKVATAVGLDTPKEGKKKEKKEKQPKPQKAPAPEKPLSPALIDLRVGHILKAINHPNADSLYVSTIACGDPPGTDNTSEYEGQIVRTVCSGLNGLIPLAELQGRKIVAVCNLKPVTMRGIKSAAMVLAASPRLAEGEADNHAGPVELVNIPAEAKAGDRVYFEGWQGEPEAVLNPKKKIWESCQPGFTTTGELEVAFDADAVEALKESGKSLGRLVTTGGVCTVTTLKGATVR